MNLKSQRSLSVISNSKGFSLGEIMIVLVIIGGIMAIVLPKIQVRVAIFVTQTCPVSQAAGPFERSAT